MVKKYTDEWSIFLASLWLFINIFITVLFLLEALHRAKINLPLHYATLGICIAGTSFHQTQL